MTVEHIVTVLCSKFASSTSFTYYDKNDLAQLIRLNAWEALPRFRPEAGSLDGFLVQALQKPHPQHPSGRFRDAFLHRPPCQICHDAHLERGPGHDGGQNCKPYLAWLNPKQDEGLSCQAAATRPWKYRRQERTREPVMAPLSKMTPETTEILRLLDSRLDVDDRRALLMMREGVQVPKRVRREVEQAVIAILEEVGLTPACDIGLGTYGCEAESVDDVGLVEPIEMNHELSWLKLDRAIQR